MFTTPFAAEFKYISDLGSSAKTIGIANIEGFNYTSSALFENPASLQGPNRLSFSFFTTTLIQEITYTNLSINYLTKYGSFAAGYMSADVSGIPNTALDNNDRAIEIDTFSYNNSLFKLGYALELGRELNLGIGATFASTEAGSFISGNGYNFDLGLSYTLEKLSFSLIGKNLLKNSPVTYSDGSEENFPSQTLFGSRYHMGDFIAYGQIKLLDSSEKPLSSLALTYSPETLKLLSLSIGYQEFIVPNEIKNNLTMGLSLYLKGIEYNYAYETSEYVEFDGNHYFSISLNFIGHSTDNS